MVKKTPYETLPANGLMLFQIHYKSQYYDNDARMPGTIPVNERFYVLASSQDEALTKSQYLVTRTIKNRYKSLGKELKEHEAIDVSPISLENLIVARDSSNDGRLGWISTTKWKDIQLSLEEDLKHYRLGVCLIPKKQTKDKK